MKTGKVLITGANGLLGQAVVSIFSRESDLTLVQSSVEKDPFVDYGIDYHKLDITNKDEVKEAVKLHTPDVILNCAAFTDVDKCETERELCWKLNVDAVKNLIIGSRINNCKLVHISTDYVFDGKSGPYNENEVPNPISFYGRSKLASENAITTSGINYAIARTMVLYGLGVKVKPNFALWLINKLSAGEPVRIVKDQIGNSTLVDDLAYGLLKLVESDKTGIYNLAGRDIESRYEFAMTVCDVFNFDKKLVSSIITSELNQPAPRPLNSGLITLKAETELGFNPMNSLDGLRLLKYQLGL